MQGDNIDYYKTLIQKLRGQTYAKQYDYIIDQITQLDSQGKSHGSASTIKDLNPYWLKQFLKRMLVR
jgi:hypothetical protein